MLFPGPFHPALRATEQQRKTWQQKKMNELGIGLGRADLFGMGHLANLWAKPYDNEWILSYKSSLE